MSKPPVALPSPAPSRRRSLLHRLGLGALLALFIPRQVLAQTSSYFGLYRAIVVNNTDPLRIGRIQLRIPDILGDTISNWALPSLPLAGVQTAMYALPQVGDTVLVAFERGDANSPVYVGGLWSNAAQVPPEVLASPNAIALVSAGQCRLILAFSQSHATLDDTREN